jgi:cation diffusion facilitator CzcD-associated flavoprotein CzcO
MTLEAVRQVAVVGAGPAGVSSALALKDRRFRPLVLDKEDKVVSSWRGRYDRLRLNTWRRFSHPPRRPFPKGTPTFPTRDQLIELLERVAAEDGVEWRLSTRVDRIDRDGDAWVVRTSGSDIPARQVIVATGHEGKPAVPDWPGREAFAGRVLHSSEYRNPAPFAGQAVLVVGPGCSGMEIAHDLAEGGAARVWLAVRTAPNIMLRQGPGGVPGDLIATAFWHAPVRIADAFGRFASRMDVGDLSKWGLPPADEGVFTRARRLGVAPAIVDRDVIDAIKAGRIEVVRAVERLGPDGAELADGARIAPDAVICATGYRRALEPLVGHLDVLDERGMPRAVGATAAAPGLRFIGYVARPSGLGYMGKEAKRAARAIEGELRNANAAAAANQRAVPRARRPLR